MNAHVTLLSLCLAWFVPLYAQSLKVQRESEVEEPQDAAVRDDRSETDRRLRRINALLEQLRSEVEAVGTSQERMQMAEALGCERDALEAWLADLSLMRRETYYALLYSMLRSQAQETDGQLLLPASLEEANAHEPLYVPSWMDLAQLTYFGGLDLKSPEARSVILFYEKKPDQKGKRLLTFLDGHIEVAVNMRARERSVIPDKSDSP
jgi:hypothetical protein